MDFDIEQYYGKMKDAVDDVQARTSSRLAENLELHEMKENAFFNMADQISQLKESSFEMNEHVKELNQKMDEQSEAFKKSERSNKRWTVANFTIVLATLIATLAGILVSEHLIPW